MDFNGNNAFIAVQEFKIIPNGNKMNKQHKSDTHSQKNNKAWSKCLIEI